MRQQRIIDGLFQAIAVRNAGFSDVAIGSVAPALQLLFVIMMYIVSRIPASLHRVRNSDHALQAAYPIAISVRSTNVYEEKSMGAALSAPMIAWKRADSQRRVI